MAEWALNYLIETPRKELGYEPVFQCHPLLCPPVPAGEADARAADDPHRLVARSSSFAVTLVAERMASPS